MTDETREPQDAPQEEPEYQEPKAEELPETDMTGSGPAAGTQTDGNMQSDREAKTAFAAVDVHAVLAAVRERR
jgi:hypothetical protein